MKTIISALSATGVVPVVVVDDSYQALKMVEALSAGGLDVVEITFRSESAPEAIAAVRKEFPDFLVGAGTLLHGDDVTKAIDAGSHFGVSPGLNVRVAGFSVEQNFPFVPGISTATELEQGKELGLNFFKLFPAEVSGGIKLLDAFHGPYPSATFMPTGGITEENLPGYLARPNVVACGGTWIAPRKVLQENNFEEVRRRAASVASLISQTRSN